MTRISAESKANLQVKRLERLPMDERLRQIEIILKAEKPFTIMREKVERMYAITKARIIKAEMREEKKKP